MKLTIAFPTYNRSDYLRRSVCSVYEQVPDLPPDAEVEITVFDNASTDNTPTVCEALKALFPSLKVHRHHENIGADPNIHQALTTAEGDYIWIFGDDDFLRPGSLVKIYFLLATEKIALLKIGSSEERDIRVTTGAAPKVVPCEMAKEITVARFNSPDEILDCFELGMGNFSSTVFSRNFIQTYYQRASSEFFNSGYSQLGWMYDGVFQRPHALMFIKDRLLVLRVEISPRHVMADQVAIGLEILSRKLLEIGYSQSSVSKLYTKQCDAILISRVKTSKILGTPFMSEVLSSMSQLSGILPRLKLLVISLMPSLLFRSVWANINRR